MKKFSSYLVCGLFLVLLTPASGKKTGQQPEFIQSRIPSSSQHLRAVSDFGKMPLYFVPNEGRLDERVSFTVTGKDRAIYFTSEGLTFVLSGTGDARDGSSGDGLGEEPGRTEKNPSRRWVIKLDFVDADPDVHPTGTEKTGAVISYFKGKAEDWQSGLPAYSGIVYHDLWPGIDLAYYGTVNELKSEFIVHPGADPSRIRLAYRGATDVAVDEEGKLEVETPAGGFHDEVPIAYQKIGGKRVDVSLAYELQPPEQEASQKVGEKEALETDAWVYGFQAGDYDRSLPLVLDPAIIVYCGYFGSAVLDQCNDIAIDSAGDVYITGVVLEAAESTFPVTVGPDLTYNGWTSDAYVAKIAASGKALVYCGYIGGASDDYGQGIAVDGAGNAYVTGYTTSYDDSFPVTVGPDLSYNLGQDAFVAKINASGTALVYCGYIGGTARDSGLRIGVDSAGNAYIAGQTASAQTSFPVTVGPDLIHNGGTDVFLAKLNSAGTTFIYCGYFGSSANDSLSDLAVDKSGNAYIVGTTKATEATFPVTVGPDLTFNGGTDDAYVAKVNASGTGLIFCGYIGGTASDYGNGIAVDGSGNAYITGTTYSDFTSGFPVTVGPDLNPNGVEDAYVAKVNASGTAFVYCGYIGGASTDFGNGIAVDKEGNAYVTGETRSAENSFPVRVGPDLTYYGGADTFVAKVKAAGTALIYCGYIGGSGGDSGDGIVVDEAGDAYICGSTKSSQTSFPVTVGPDLTYNGSGDTFIVKIQGSSSIIADFGAAGFGLWKWNNDVWTQMTGSDAGGMVVANTDSVADSELAVDFDSLGLWLWDNADWHQLSGVNPDFMITLDKDGSGDLEIAVDFGSLGLWLWDSGGWTQLSGVNAQDMIAADVDRDKADELIVDFGTLGVWRWDSGAWQQWTGVNPQGMAAADIQGDNDAEVFIAFGAFGLWQWDEGAWSQISPASPEYMISADTDGNGKQELVVDLGSVGIWKWDGIAWNQMSIHDPEYMIAVDIDASGDDEVIIDRGTSGLWVWDDDVLNQMSVSNPELMISADTNGDGDKEIIIDFGGLGLWHWDDGTWTLLTMASPDNMVAEEIQ
jgi:hypothetical protein